MCCGCFRRFSELRRDFSAISVRWMRVDVLYQKMPSLRSAAEPKFFFTGTLPIFLGQETWEKGMFR